MTNGLENFIEYLKFDLMVEGPLVAMGAFIWGFLYMGKKASNDWKDLDSWRNDYLNKKSENSNNINNYQI